MLLYLLDKFRLRVRILFLTLTELGAPEDNSRRKDPSVHHNTPVCRAFQQAFVTWLTGADVCPEKREDAPL
jgi:hypothetical protein